MFIQFLHLWLIEKSIRSYLMKSTKSVVYFWKVNDWASKTEGMKILSEIHSLSFLRCSYCCMSIHAVCKAQRLSNANILAGMLFRGTPCFRISCCNRFVQRHKLDSYYHEMHKSNYYQRVNTRVKLNHVSLKYKRQKWDFCEEFTAWHFATVWAAVKFECPDCWFFIHFSNNKSSTFSVRFRGSVNWALLSSFCDDSNLHISVFKEVLYTMSVSKESIRKFLIRNRFHIKSPILSPNICKQSLRVKIWKTKAGVGNLFG